MKRNGFTLVEILIAMTIVIFLVMAMVGIFNATGTVDKGRDTQRKKDLKRIKVAFEEYLNDKGSYPMDVGTWNKMSNCGSAVFSPYLSPWPCDPDGKPYMIIVEKKDRFRVLTNLKNKKDKDIPTNWYTRTDILLTGFTANSVNFGVSSSDIVWYDEYIDPSCNTSYCLAGSVGGSCGTVDGCAGGGCFYPELLPGGLAGGDCLSKCQISCCGDGCN
ncbi:MAG: type II secretion system protein [Candidatus Shapirobacteria bacterium]|nr:type II secretion system protein [Candidatus Shapirobacteria bacterium]MDD3002315.1 type II secretion system protein [Candidatus Shapirobacteria bacterium]MDD4382680.1 type II secretion system protein [Candidatus Shapirobacteria bacterium]